MPMHHTPFFSYNIQSEEANSGGADGGGGDCGVGVEGEEWTGDFPGVRC